ncbi:cation-translocating P-type ATPase [Nocardioides sp. zg-1228]|uniref:cation-translocating P-type ATPase n=1 Tax=Nocardioides sp. zg-1228 TaxID=2763008 RepID=UPI0016432D07|nr:cation-translocating P-type ATPase [Nocardioides sp. zg-1228]MBC2932179.1 cation-translocating P-type ATPase [Nocardioides sp. zg-1228]QSF57717.1 cation-translocating P-type ATPase [Nocardioides sp. zg-1228]
MPEPVDPSQVDAEVLLGRLEVDPATGLSTEEAQRRLRRDGPNELRAKKPVPTWRKILAQFEDPLVYLLLAAIAISTISWFVEGGEGVPVDAIVIAAIVVMNAVLGYTQEARAEDAVAALSTMTAASSTVLRDGRLQVVPSAELVRGDVLVLNEGDAVGADGRLLSATALRVQEASLTGESEAVTKSPATLERLVPLGDRVDMVYKGTAVAQGVGRAVVTGVGMSTEVGAIAEMLDATVEEPTPLQTEVGRIGRMLGIIVVVIAVVVMAVIVVVQGVSTASDFVVVLLLGVSLAVAAVPEGLPAILSVVLAIGVQRMARRNAVVKRLDSVEALGSASVICTDKTGTLTRNEMTIERLVTASGRADVSGVGYRPDGAVTAGGGDLSEQQLAEARLLLGAGSLANNAQLSERDGEWTIQGDPTEAAFLVAARKLEGVTERLERFERRTEIPFTSERKMMSTLHEERPDGTRLLFSKGAPDVLLANCTRQQVGATTVPLTDAARAERLAEVEALSGEAFRTLGVAYRVVDDPDEAPPDGSAGADDLDTRLEHDLVYVGVVGIIDPPRVEVAAAIAEAHRAGIRVIMITGDHPTTARRIATDLGIVGPGARAVTGTELDGLEGDALREVIREVSVYARVAPQHKLMLVDALQDDGEIVAMTGDGVNDAPALKSADIGVAMGITGTEVTKEASRMILADDNFATIVAAVRQGRVIFDNIKKFLRYLLSSNMGEVLTVFLGVVFAGMLGLSAASDEAIVLPLLATQILWINLVTDSTPALAMGVDPEIDDVMARRPRRLTERAIDGRMWGGIVTVGLVMALVALFAIDLFLPGGLVEGSDTFEVARTAGFTTLVLAQLFNALNARSETTSAFHGLFANPWLWASIALGAVLQLAVVEVPFLQVAFGTHSLDLAHWGACVALASVVLWYDEVRKAIIRARSASSPAVEDAPADRMAGAASGQRR